MKTKEVRGITIISLVVTIVVLLILAGISINAVIGDNGIIKKAQNSAELTKESEAKEIINRIVMEFYLTNDYETLEDFLNDKVLSGKIDKIEKNTDGTLKVWKDNYSVTVENKTNSSNNNDNNVNKTIKISAIPYEGIYDGNEHEAITAINVEPTDTILEYSTDGTNYFTAIPTITNAGTTSIRIRASKENYATKNVTVTAKIEKAEGRLVLSETSGTINYPNSTTFTVSGNTGTLSVSSSNTSVATVSISSNIATINSVGAGTAIITVKSEVSGNYNEKTAMYSVTVVDDTFLEESGVGFYADTDGDGTVDGVIFADFKKGESGSWGGQSYTISAVTNLKEYYISQKGYTGKFGTKSVLSARGSGNARFNVMALNDYNNGKTYSFDSVENITSGSWRTPTKEEWAMFAGKLGINKSNYSRKYGLKSPYCTSSPNRYNLGYYISFGEEEVESDDFGNASGYVRLCRTF